jgi:mycothiol synthase
LYTFVIKPLRFFLNALTILKNKKRGFMNLPDGFTYRAPTIADVDAVAALADTVAYALIERGAIESPHYLLNTWFGAGQDYTQFLEGRHLLVFTPDNRLVAYLETENELTDGFFWFNIILHPDFSSESLFHALRAQAEAWGQAQVALQPPGEYQLITQGWAQDTRYASYVKSAGYDTVRFWKRMEIEMDTPPPPPRLSNGFTIRPYRGSEDDPKIFEAWREAMAEDWGTTTDLTLEEFLFYKVSRETEQDLSLWRFAMEGEEIAGFTIARWERTGDPDVGHIRDVGVHRAYRRQGLALALLHATFAEFYRQGKRRVSLGVDGLNANGANHLYERAGMTATLTQYKYGKPLTTN